MVLEPISTWLCIQILLTLIYITLFCFMSIVICNCVGILTGFLPSSFSMYAMSLSSGLLLLEKPAMAVAVAATGVILGWPFSVLAFLPVTVYSLTIRFKQAFTAGAVTSVSLLVSLFNCLSIFVRSTSKWE